jgi:hypothetical protein
MQNLPWSKKSVEG